MYSDALGAFVPDLRAALEPCPLHMKISGPGGVERIAPGTYPYAFLLPVSVPQGSEWESFVGFELHVVGPQYRVSELRDSVSWLNGHLAGDSGTARGVLVFSWGNAQLYREPEIRMPDGSDVWHLRDPYRVSYGDVSRLQAPTGVMP